MNPLTSLSPINDNSVVEIAYTEVFEKWLHGLRDQRAKVFILSRIERIEDGNFGDYRSVGNGVSELRINAGQGY